jgi:hypothetical protein
MQKLHILTDNLKYNWDISKFCLKLNVEVKQDDRNGTIESYEET